MPQERTIATGPGGFIGGYMAGKAFDQQQRAGEADISVQQEAAKKAQMENLLAAKAMKAQVQVEDAIRGVPNLAEMMATDPEKALATIANAQADAGLIAASVDTLNKGAKAGEASAKAAKARLDASSLRAEHVASAFANVDGPRSWNEAIANVMEAFPDQAKAFQNLMTLPDKAAEKGEDFDYAKVAEGISRAALTDSQRMKIERDQAAADYSKALENESRVRAKVLIPAQAAHQRALATAKAKAGDKVKSPTVTDAARMIKSKYNVTTEDGNVMALEVAEDADRYMRANPTMTKVDALKRAFRQAEESGVFEGRKRKTERQGQSADNPFQAPEDRYNPAAYQENMFYETRQGPMIWDGERMQPPEAIDAEEAAERALRSGEEEEEESEEEEEEE